MSKVTLCLYYCINDFGQIYSGLAIAQNFQVYKCGMLAAHPIENKWNGLLCFSYECIDQHVTDF